VPAGISPYQTEIWDVKRNGSTYRAILRQYTYGNPVNDALKFLDGVDAINRFPSSMERTDNGTPSIRNFS
jgi:hypothetical protein